MRRTIKLEECLGYLECIICQRELGPSQFSKSQIKRALKVTDSIYHNIKAVCKGCVTQPLQTISARTQNIKVKIDDSLLFCICCCEEKTAEFFSKNQVNKIRHNKDGKCLSCVINNNPKVEGISKEIEEKFSNFF